ncbi:WD40 repeat domain-containing protein [Dactylosporangium sp. CS-047395]|uniref:WD40 repeat domain-containing protein n=1 Tax=Dactylosporangium sp. CS-047395 TaxID=3239936 RepID=UPI003D8B340C
MVADNPARGRPGRGTVLRPDPQRRLGRHRPGRGQQVRHADPLVPTGPPAPMRSRPAWRRGVAEPRRAAAGGEGAGSPDSQSIAVAGRESIAIINAADGSLRTTITVDQARFSAFAWSPDSSALATARTSDPYDLRVWDATNGACLRRIELAGVDLLREVVGVAWPPAPYTLLVHAVLAGDQEELLFFDAGGDVPVRRETVPWRSSYDRSMRWYSRSHAKSPIVIAADQIAVIGPDMAGLVQLPSSSWTALQRLDLRSALWSPDLRRVVVFVDGGIAAVDLDTGTVVRPMPVSGRSYAQPHAAWSPHGDRLVVADDQGLVVVDPIGGAVLGRREGLHPDVQGVLWSPDGSLLMRISQATLELLETENWNRVRTVEMRTGESWSADFAPGGGRLAIAPQPFGGTQIVDTADGRTGRGIGPSGVCRLAWSSGDLLAIGTKSGRVEIVDARSGTTVAVCEGDPRAVRLLAWQPAGHLVAAASNGRFVRVWRASDGAPMAVFDLAHRDKVLYSAAADLRWLDGGRRLDCALSDGQVLSWRLPESAEEVLAGVEEPVAPLPPEVRARYGLRL